MPARRVSDRLLVWGSTIEDSTLEQAERTARVPVVAGHVALMPDAHIGIGATIGSVIPTDRAIIPSAVGVDIGCGMVAVRTDVRVDQLPDSLSPLLARIARVVPAGVGQGHARATRAAEDWLQRNPPPRALTDKQIKVTRTQFGTLGSGNHFFEICSSSRDEVWLVLHSGSRGIGNQLATEHIREAKKDMAERLVSLEDPDLSYLVEGTEAFERYVADMRWAQRYAMANRAQMMDAAVGALTRFLGTGREVERINCHHNFAQQETHGGRTVWITRKGAIRAGAGELGIVPGSMGSPTYIVRGLGNPASYASCAHGAGRRLSRRQARKTIALEDLHRVMAGKVWNAERARLLIDESPAAYKDIEQVMADQEDLVEVVETLTQLLNYKGQ